MLVRYYDTTGGRLKNTPFKSEHGSLYCIHSIVQGDSPECGRLVGRFTPTYPIYANLAQSPIKL